MTLVMYNAEQDALRLYSTGHGQWMDMIAYGLNDDRRTPLHWLAEFGWEVIGEL